MSEPTLYRTHDDDPLMSGKSLRSRFKMAASLLWARGLPPPTADEIADAMTKVLVPVEPDIEAAIDYRHIHGRPKCYEGLDEYGCECRGSVLGIVKALGIGGEHD